MNTTTGRSFFQYLIYSCVLIIFMNGCGDQIVSSIQEGVTLSEHENSSNSREGPSTHDDKLRNLTLEVPGFGGYYFDEAGQLVVNLTDTKQRDQAVVALLARLERGELSTIAEKVRQLTVKEVGYDFAMLDDWRYAILKNLSVLHRITTVDVNEITNRVEIGVPSSDLIQAIYQTVKHLGIPEDAVYVFEEQFAMRYSDWLIDRRPTLRGGLTIENLRGDVCTLGFLSISTRPGYYGTQGFLVNSHCTHIIGIPDGQRISQGGNRIGYERIDAPFFTNADNSKCLPNYLCQWADAAFISYEPDSYERTYRYGEVYATLSSSPTHGTREIDWGRFFKVKYAESAELGQQVQKVGRETGWTYGTLTNTCQDVFLSDKTAVMCSYKVSGGSQNGDSGAPVFGIIGNPPYYDPDAKSYAIDVNAYGILWGGSTNYFWYSPIGLVSQEVGPVRITK